MPVVQQKGLMFSGLFPWIKNIKYLFHPVSYTELAVEVLTPRVDFPVTGEKNRHVRPTVNLHTNI